ncbi:MAG: radical SAM protein [Lachnospiraceae bacterium]|nr:radical SAM protein [Lachnospiraceae bacterium]
MKSITIELTQRCPNQCLYCSSFSGECSPQTLTVSIIERIIEDAHKLGATEVAFSGGEPLIQMTELIAGIVKAKELGMQIYVYTSGLLPSDQTISHTIVQPIWIWHTLKKYDKNLIPVFDIPTLECAMYDFITLYDRLQDRWSDVCSERRLIRIQHLMRQIYSEVGLNPQINFVPMNINCNSIQQIFEWASANKMRTNVLAYVEQGRAKKYRNLLSMTWFEFDRFRVLLNDLAILTRGKTVTDKPIMRYDVRIGTPLTLGNDSQCSGCTACREKCVVRYDGQVIGCEAFKQLSIINGTLEDDPHKAFGRNIYTMSLATAVGKNSNFEAVVSTIKSIMEKVKARTPCPVQNLMYNRPEAHDIHKIGEYRYE